MCVSNEKKMFLKINELENFPRTRRVPLLVCFPSRTYRRWSCSSLACRRRGSSNSRRRTALPRAWSRRSRALCPFRIRRSVFESGSRRVYEALEGTYGECSERAYVDLSLHTLEVSRSYPNRMLETFPVDTSSRTLRANRYRVAFRSQRAPCFRPKDPIRSPPRE